VIRAQIFEFDLAEVTKPKDVSRKERIAALKLCETDSS
jgi:hypothetical protein